MCEHALCEQLEHSVGVHVGRNLNHRAYARSVLRIEQFGNRHSEGVLASGLYAHVHACQPHNLRLDGGGNRQRVVHRHTRVTVTSMHQAMSHVSNCLCAPSAAATQSFPEECTR